MHIATGARQHVLMALDGLKEPQMHQPAHHVVMSFVSADDATIAVLLLHQAGLPSTDIACYTPGQMRARAAIVLGRVCPPTPPGLEPELVATQRELARLGRSFVLVCASTESQLQRIGWIAAEAHATAQTSPSGATRGQHSRSAAPPIASSTLAGRRQTTAHHSTAT